MSSGAHPNSLKHLRPFAKGQTGNPGGRPGIPEELKAIKALSYFEVARIISKIARMSRPEVKKMLADASQSVLYLSIGSIFEHSISRGDFTRLSFLLDRSIGKVREMEEDEDDAEARKDLTKLSMHQLLTLVQDNMPQVDK